MTTKIISFIAFLVLITVIVKAQDLKPGFDPGEYAEVLKRCAGHANHLIVYNKEKLKPAYDLIYRSKETGLDNHWDMWMNKEKTIIAINIRGTVGQPDSWTENFYSAMIPASGSIKMDSNYTFNYKFATDPRAMVHAGWTIGVGSMVPEISKVIEKYYAQGIKQVIIEGHSQGGAISFLLSSWLHYQVADGKLPKDLVIKTYCSAAPKPGNMYYTYDYDYINRGGWAFTVVSAADWVPETPFSVQTLKDINKTNPFTHIGTALGKQNAFIALYLGHIYKQLTRFPFKAERKNEKYLGRAAYKRAKKFLPYLEMPPHTRSGNYMPAGIVIALPADEQYYNLFPDSDTNIFAHHMFEQYYFLLKKAYQID